MQHADVPQPRRALLRLAAAGAAAFAATVFKSGAARAADGDAVLLAGENVSDNTTVIRSGGVALYGISRTDDGALVGESTASDGYGVRATAPYIGLNAVGGEIAVYAVSDYGLGVHALTYDGVAVEAATAVEAGTALKVDGRAVFKLSGLLVIPPGAKSATQTNVPLTLQSLVLATLQQRRDEACIEAAVPDPDNRRFTVHLNKRVSRGTTVAWIIIN
jgi:hypothetical protein